VIEAAIKKLVDRQDLSRAEVTAVFGEMMDGKASDIHKTAFLVALRMKGEKPEEITGAVMALRQRVIPLDVDADSVIDTCGTGGDARGTFNISTVSAIVAAAAGIHVAKHGNRAVSSSCGSADLLSALGVRIDLEPARTAVVLKQVGIAFLFAPKLHPAMAAVAGVRRELGVRTIFNLIGPLANPAFARRQVMGVYSPLLIDTVGQVLIDLGSEHALVVHSRDGMDEISISAPTEVCEVRGGVMKRYDLTPEQIGVSPAALHEIQGGSAEVNARIAREVLDGKPGAPLEVVIANAGAAMYVGGGAKSIREGATRVREVIRSGAAKRKLEELVSATNES
jgi:anthranilate phosphoribosyltransferase